MATIDRWNQRYRSGERGPGSPSLLVTQAVGGLRPGRALDLACGPGRNAIWLARQGWEVVAIDGSEAAIELLGRADARIEARLLDLEQQPVPFADATFDLVCIINFLHRPLFAEARRLVRQGGMAVAAIHTIHSAMNPRYAIGAGELRSYFAGWELLVDREGELAEIAARRPVTSNAG